MFQRKSRFVAIAARPSTRASDGQGKPASALLRESAPIRHDDKIWTLFAASANHGANLPDQLCNVVVPAAIGKSVKVSYEFANAVVVVKIRKV